MPYFPVVEDRTYTCQGCGGAFVVKSTRFVCAVAHPSGTCCHYGEHDARTGELIGPDGKTASQRATA